MIIRTPRYLLLVCVASAIFGLTCANKRSLKRTNAAYFTLEQFGGEAWYLPMDGRLQEDEQYPLISYTPYSINPGILKGTKLKGENYTLITALSDKKVFDDDIVGKSFCGLFVHQNPASSSPEAVDAYYPQEVGSRYSKVVYRLNPQQVIVDFEYNGGNRNQIQSIDSGKGYFFHDNSKAWEALRLAFTELPHIKNEIRLASFEINDCVQKVYVIPQYRTWEFDERDCKIWSGTAEIPRLKIGYEDYYRHEKENGVTILNQDRALFSLPGRQKDHNLIVHAKIYPPHRTIKESSTFMRTVFTGRKAGGITALVGSTQLDEERFIKVGTGLSDETFITFNFSQISAGGKSSGAKMGVLEDIEDYGYVLCKNYEQRGPFFTSMNGDGGHFLVVEDADLYFHPQKEINPPSQMLEIKLVQGSGAYDGFPENIKKRKSNYLPYTFEVTDQNNLNKIKSLGGSNRTNLITIEGESNNLSFLMNTQGIRADNPGEFTGYWDFCYSTDHKDNYWGFDGINSYYPGRTSSKMMLVEEIPVSGKKYLISREYLVKESYEELGNESNAKIGTVNRNGKTASRDPQKGKMYSNVVRTAICWTTVLNKYANDIKSSEIPENAKPLALQPGDKFKIPSYPGSKHDPNKIYTVLIKERGIFPMFPAEFVGIRDRKNWQYNFSNAQSYRYFWCELDQDLPSDVGLTFEIEMVKSTSEILLDGKPRNAWQTYKGVSRIGPDHRGKPNQKQGKGRFYTQDLPFDSEAFSEGEPLGHLCYSQVELTEWYKNVHWNNGFYRQNSNGGRGYKKYPIKNQKGKTIKTEPIARYSHGKTFINCTGGPMGQYSNGLNDFEMIHQILYSEKGQTEIPYKMRLYNSPDVRTDGMSSPDFYLEVYDSSEGAPDMPEACRRLLNSLPGVN
ncbi:hypothetical protein GYB22_12815 [bacterium]|nr:hypothetical protein [bacterium]